MKKRIIAVIICITMIISLAACGKKPKEGLEAPVVTITPERTAEEAFDDAIAVVKARLSGFSLDEENTQKKLNDLKGKQIKDIAKVNQDMKIDLKFATKVLANKEIDEIKVIAGAASDADNQVTAANIGIYTNDSPTIEASLLIDLKNTQFYLSDGNYDSSAYGKNGIPDNSKWRFANFKDLFETTILGLTEEIQSTEGKESIVDSAKEGLNYYLWMFDLVGDDQNATEEQYEEIVKKISAFEWNNTKKLIKDNLKFSGTAENGHAIFEKKLSEMIVPVIKDTFELSKTLQSDGKNKEELAEIDEQNKASLKEIIDILISAGDPSIKFSANFSEVEGKLQTFNIFFEIDQILFDEEGENKISNIKLAYSLHTEDQTLIATDHMKNNSQDITEYVDSLVEGIKELTSPSENTDEYIWPDEDLWEEEDEWLYSDDKEDISNMENNLGMD